MRNLIALALLLIAPGGAALAHGVTVEPTGTRWTLDPWIVMPLMVLGGGYAIGSVRLWQRRRLPTQAWSAARGAGALAFWSGWLTLVGALVSPLHWLGERLFTFHMVEHEILMAISAPLLIAARPLGVLMWALPRGARRNVGRVLRAATVQRAWRWLSSGGPATALHGIAIWLWHVPPLFDAAVANVALHRAQHLSFLLTALLFWWVVLWRSGAGVGAWHVFVTMMHTSMLGALMALAPRVLYTVQTATAAEWGMTPLEDQQLAGLIMWVPAGTIYAGAALALLALWVSRAGARTETSHATRTA